MDFFFKVKSVAQVQEDLFAFPRLPGEEVGLLEALGRYVAEPIYAREDLPPFSRSTMDGYAVRARDVFGARENEPVILRVKGEIPMGVAPDFELGPGEAARIATGGMLPSGADAVVMVEYTEEIGPLVEIRKPVSPGENVLFQGDDVKAGEILLNAGERLTPGKLGLLAHAGITRLKVHQRPHIAIISTGDELVPPDQRPSLGQIRDTNSYSLATGVIEAGGRPILLGIVPDKEEALFKALEQGIERAQVVLISGGSSVGTRDYTLRCIERLPGAQILCHGVAVRPGKPTILAKVGDKAVFGLPGQMASALLVFYILVRPLLLHLQGSSARDLGFAKIKARASRNIPSTQGREDYIRVLLEEDSNGICWAKPIFRRSGLISSMAKAQGLLRIPEKSEGVYQGEEVEVLLLP